jgi:hypothetical protein
MPGRFSVAGDGLGQDHLVGGFDEFVGEFAGQGVLHAVAGHRGFGAECDEQNPSIRPQLD